MQANKRVACTGVDKDETPMISLSGPTGAWSYCEKDKTLQMMVDGTHQKYEWLGALDMNVDVGIAVAIDMPVNTPPQAKAKVAEQFAVYMVNYLVKKLGIDISTFKVVCVHPPGEPCLKNRKMRARRSTAKSILPMPRLSRREGASEPTAYELEYEIVAPNDLNTTVDAEGQYTPEYFENKALAEKAIADIKKETAEGSLGSLVADATADLKTSNATHDVQVGGVTAYGVHAESEVAADDFAASIDVSGGFVEYGSLTGSVFHDKDGNTLFGKDDAALPGVNVLLHQGNTLKHTATANNDGYWHVENVPTGAYNLTIDMSTLPSRTHPYRWIVRGDTNEDGGAVAANVQASGATPIAIMCTEWATVTGKVTKLVDEVPVVLEGVGVWITDQSGGKYDFLSLTLHPVPCANRCRLMPRPFCECTHICIAA